MLVKQQTNKQKILAEGTFCNEITGIRNKDT